jgi:hypothetical protein
MEEPACSALLVESGGAAIGQSVRIEAALEKPARRGIGRVQTEWLRIIGPDRSSAFLM